MKNPYIKLLLCGALAAGALSAVLPIASLPTASANEIAMTPQQKAMLRRAAQVSAYRSLAEKIYGVQIIGDTCVADLAKENDKVSSSLEAMIRGVRLADPRYYPDGTCEVDAEVTIQQVITTIKHSYDNVNDNGNRRREQLDEISKRTERSVISATGFAFVRGGIVVGGGDGGILPVLHKPVGPHDNVNNLPPIWVKAGGEERLRARRMAELDGYRHLNERMKGVLISGASTGENFLLKNDNIHAATEGLVRGARIVDINYGDDGLCQVTMQVTIQEVVEHYEHALDQVDKNGFNKEREELTNVEKHCDRKIIQEIGVGAVNVGGPTPGQ